MRQHRSGLINFSCLRDRVSNGGKTPSAGDGTDGCAPDPCCSSDRFEVEGEIAGIYPPFASGSVKGKFTQVRERDCQRTQPQEYDPDIDPYYWE